jgi:hypothetical protein
MIPKLWRLAAHPAGSTAHDKQLVRSRRTTLSFGSLYRRCRAIHINVRPLNSSRQLLSLTSTIRSSGMFLSLFDIGFVVFRRRASIPYTLSSSSSCMTANLTILTSQMDLQRTHVC